MELTELNYTPDPQIQAMMHSHKYLMEGIIRKFVSAEENILKRVLSTLLGREVENEDGKRLTKMIPYDSHKEFGDYYFLAFDGYKVGKVERYYGMESKITFTPET